MDERLIGAKTLKDIERIRDGLKVGQGVRVLRPEIQSTGAIVFHPADAVILEKYKHHFLVEDERPVGHSFNAKHKRKWSVKYIDLLSDAMYDRDVE